MTITLYENFSKRENSTKRPTEGTEKSIALKNGTSIINPTFVLSGVPNMNWNYVKWEDNYYYIIDIILSHNTVWEIDCRLDVLATFKTEIGNYSPYVMRSASSYDLNMFDSLYPTKLERSSAAVSTAYNPTILESELGYYVLGVLGRGGTQLFYLLPNAAFADLCNALFPQVDGLSNIVDWMSSTVSEALAGGLANIMQYITYIKYVPFSFSRVASLFTSTHTVNIGPFSVHIDLDVRKGTSYKVYDAPTHTFAITRPNTDRGKWVAAEPFTTYYLTAGPFGLIRLNSQQIAYNGSIAVKIYAEPLSGNMTLVISDGTSQEVRYTSNVAIDVKTGGATLNTTGLATSAATGLLSAAVGNPIGAAASIISAVTNTLPTPVQQGGSYSGINPMFNESWNIYAIHYDPTEENLEEFGRPLCKVKQIKTLSGFVQCANASISIPGHSDEAMQINNALNGGFFYE